MTATNQGVYRLTAGGINERRVSNYTVVYRVTTDDSNDGPLVVMAAVPALYSSYNIGGLEFNLAALLTSKQAELQEKHDVGGTWHVTCNYSTDADADQGAENPLDRPTQISGSFVQFVSPIFADVNGDPIETKAHEPFDPPLEQDDSRLTLIVTKNVASVNLPFIASYRDAINSDTFVVRGLSFPPRFVKFNGFSFSEQAENGVDYFQTVTELHVNDEPWNPRKVLHQGFRYLDAGEPKTFLDKDGTPLNSPALLDAAGGKLATGAAPVFLEFTTYNERAFGALALD